MPDRSPRVLMLASYFPKPLNPLMGNWALLQAQSFQRNGIPTVVVSPTSWVPGVLGITRGAKAYASCPEQHEWDGVTAYYPRWPYYPVGPARWLNTRFPALPLRLAWASVRGLLLNLVKEFRPDVIYAHHTGVNGYLAWLLQGQTGLPFLVTDHDFGEIESCRVFPARRQLFASVTRNASAMIAVAKRMENELRAQFPWARAHTVPNGSNPLPADITGTPRPAALQGKQIIFSCGTFYERKAFPLLVDAFARVARDHPDAQLRIAGDGEQRAEVEKRINEHRLDGRVVLLGAQPHSTVMQEMAWCDAFALIGWDEPFATVYLEALAAAKPVICCSDGGITDVIRHEEHGLTVPPRDVPAAAAALDRLLTDKATREALGTAAGRLFETTLTWDMHAKQMGLLFQAASKP